MPIEALRLSSESRAMLRRLGFKSAGALLDKPRAPLAARFADELLDLDKIQTGQMSFTFEEVDADGNGKITPAELEAFLRKLDAPSP